MERGARAHGQDGPREVGTRYTGEGINLNRDYTKMAAVEMPATPVRKTRAL